jgi:hypothetical protein
MCLFCAWYSICAVSLGYLTPLLTQVMLGEECKSCSSICKHDCMHLQIAQALRVSLLGKCQHVRVAQISHYVHQVQQEDLIQVVT